MLFELITRKLVENYKQYLRVEKNTAYPEWPAAPADPAPPDWPCLPRVPQKQFCNENRSSKPRFPTPKMLSADLEECKLEEIPPLPTAMGFMENYVHHYKRATIFEDINIYNCFNVFKYLTVISF